MADMKATARIPCRPLSIINKNLAEAKELLVDYDKGTISVCKADGTIVDVSDSIKEVVIEQIGSDPDFVDNIVIEIDGNTYSLNTIIIDHTTQISDIQDALGYSKDNSGNVSFKILDDINTDIQTNTKNISNNTSKINTNTSNIAANTKSISDQAKTISTHSADIVNIKSDIIKIGDNISDVNNDISTMKNSINTNTSNIASNTSKINTNTTNISTNTKNISNNTKSISDTNDRINNLSTDDITVKSTSNKLFVTKAEKEDYAKATYPEIIRTTIKGGESNWTGTEAPYTQQVTVDDILEADVPVVDISLSDIYETAQKQLDSYAYIYRILTYDGSIVVYASKPTEDDVTIQMKVDR